MLWVDASSGSVPAAAWDALHGEDERGEAPLYIGR